MMITSELRIIRRTVSSSCLQEGKHVRLEHEKITDI